MICWEQITCLLGLQRTVCTYPDTGSESKKLHESGEMTPTTLKKDWAFLKKSVPDRDEDTATIAVEAARSALQRSGLAGVDIGAIYVGSESHPYAVKPTATIVAEAIRATPELMAADYEFACKAGTAALQTCLGLVAADYIKYGMAIGADTAQGAPADALEYTAAAGRRGLRRWKKPCDC